MADIHVGQGTTFDIFLPATAERSETGQYPEERLQHETQRILFVDDEVAITKMDRLVLGRLGYLATSRTSNLEALELFPARPAAGRIIHAGGPGPGLPVPAP